jgi:hypothetical protein
MTSRESTTPTSVVGDWVDDTLEVSDLSESDVYECIDS